MRITESCPPTLPRLAGEDFSAREGQLCSASLSRSDSELLDPIVFTDRRKVKLDGSLDRLSRKLHQIQGFIEKSCLILLGGNVGEKYSSFVLIPLLRGPQELCSEVGVWS